MYYNNYFKNNNYIRDFIYPISTEYLEDQYGGYYKCNTLLKEIISDIEEYSIKSRSNQLPKYMRSKTANLKNEKLYVFRVLLINIVNDIDKIEVIQYNDEQLFLLESPCRTGQYAVFRAVKLNTGEKIKINNSKTKLAKSKKFTEDQSFEKSDKFDDDF